MWETVKNMALALENRNRNGIESDIRASEEHRKRAGEENRKALHYRSQ